MEQVDYIIVGLGLAGLAFTRELEKNGKSFIVYEDDSQHSSKVAGGMYNPVILKRFTPVWNALQQIEKAIPFYNEMEVLLDAKYDVPQDVYRLFTSIEEQNNWFVACDKPSLSDYMVPTIQTQKYFGIESPFGYGKLIKTGRIDTSKLLGDFRKYLISKEKLQREQFDYSAIQFSDKKINYKKISSSKIVFCEGFGIKKNPFFKQLPIQEAKGELITIHAPELEIDFVLKSSVFIMPLGNQLFLVGATFNWRDKSNTPTEEGKKELVQKLDKIISVSYKVVKHVAGIRPTVKDRRPLVGVHKEHSQLAVLNGLGTRGVMIAPTAAHQLYNYLEQGKPLPIEVDIARFQ